MSATSKATRQLDEQAIDALHAMVCKAAAIVDLVEHSEGMEGAPFYALWAAREQLEAAEAILADALRLPPGLVPGALSSKAPAEPWGFTAASTSKTAKPLGMVWINAKQDTGNALRQPAARGGKKGGAR